ncbi:hypothetical protein XELAEV_18031811mg [Xenopus laevis]|uniref:Uncharacterized protein n=1 Tax=Xenopus laevis TaxID=8355 RepID=A0A974HG08_XENLA|nr:hypothetical protein XELAEV_18031811mg [Xenopus laevis]
MIGCKLTFLFLGSEVSRALMHRGIKGNNGRNEGNHYLSVTLASAWDISLGFMHILIENIIMGGMGKQRDYRQLRINTQKYILAFGRMLNNGL